MPEIRKPAVKIYQGKRTLLVTSFTIKDFLLDDFYTVDRLDVQERTGKQRMLDEPRIKRLAKDLLAANKLDEAFLPTSVFLATKGEIEYDETSKELFFDYSSNENICPFDVVDGQHRIEGLIEAVKQSENKDLLDFPISVVIAPNLTEAERMLQFIVVNTKQEKVSKGVSQTIIARFTEMDGMEDLPYLPDWLNREVKKEENFDALGIILRLNNDDDSIWKNKIQLADKKKDAQVHTIKQESFAPLLKRYIFTANHPINTIFPRKDSKFQKLLKNFFQAIANVFVDSSDDTPSIIFGTIGLEFSLYISGPVLNQLAQEKQYTVEAFENCIFNVSPQENPEMMNPEFWKRGGLAGGLNKSAIQKLAQEFCDALAIESSGEIQV